MTSSVETDLEAQTKAHSGVKRPLVPPATPPMHTPSPQPPPGADPQLSVANTNVRHNGNPPVSPTAINSDIRRGMLLFTIHDWSFHMSTRRESRRLL